MGITRDGLSVTFYRGDERYAYRSWGHAPRIGETVMLNDPKAKRKVAFIVTEVVWGVEGPDGDDLGKQAVNISIAPAP